MKISDKIRDLLLKAQRVGFTQNQLDEQKGYVTLQVAVDQDGQFNLVFDKWEEHDGSYRHTGHLYPLAWSDSLAEAIKELAVDLDDCEQLETEDAPAFITVKNRTYQLVD